MSSAVDTNTPQPYANANDGNVERSSSNVASPLDPAPTQNSTSESKPQSSRPQDRPAPMSGRLSSAPPSKQLSTTASGENEKPAVGHEHPQEEEKGAARGEGNPDGNGNAPSTEPEGGYPEQRHAGHLDGVGPEFGSVNRTTIGDRAKGVKEQIKGTIKRDPELKQRGKDRMTGELKKKEKAKEEEHDPFNNAKEDKSEDKDKAKEETEGAKTESNDANKPTEDDNEHDAKPKTQDDPSNKQQPSAPVDEQDKNPDQQAQSGTSDVPTSHPTEKGAMEQAASVKPEGSGERTDAEKQAKATASSAEIPTRGN